MCDYLFLDSVMKGSLLEGLLLSLLTFCQIYIVVRFKHIDSISLSTITLILLILPCDVSIIPISYSHSPFLIHSYLSVSFGKYVLLD